MTFFAGERQGWIDVARGFAMVLVVFGHALIGVSASLEPSRFGEFCLLMIYCIHMPTFFALAAVLSDRLIARPLGTFLHAIATRFFWPYVLWSGVLLFMHFLMSDYTNTAVDSFQPWRILWKPPAVMWFLYWLLAAVLARKLLRGSPILMILAGVFCLLPPYLVELPDGHVRFVGLYLLIGAVPPAKIDRMLQARLSLIVLPIMVFTAFYAWCVSGAGWTGYPASTIAFVPAMFASPILVAITAKYFALRGEDFVLVRFLALLGQNSMAIFVLHVFFTAGSRILFMRMGLTDFWLLTTTSCGLGIFGPLALANLATRLRIGPALGWQRP